MDNAQYQKLAAEFIDMWQKQLGTMVTDKQFIETMFASLQQMANYARPDAYERPTSTPPHDVDERFSQLDFRLRMVEQRLQKLESQRQPKANTKPAAKRRQPASASKVSKPAKSS